MSETKYTPGPWKWEPMSAEVYHDGILLATVEEPGWRKQSEGLANGRLISVAPEMAEAGKELLATLMGKLIYLDQAEAYNKLWAALQKAGVL